MRLADASAVGVSVPASTANLGPGFDAIGLALGLWDDYEVRLTGDSLTIDVSGQGADQVPRDERHLVFRCLARGLGRLGYDVPGGLHLTCTNRVPHSRGLGSSATAAVAGFALASALDGLARTGRPQLDKDFVNELAAQAEGHPDNSSASVFGGMTLSWSDDVTAVRGVHTAQVQVHPDVVPVVLVPDIELSTAAARAALPTDVPLKSAAWNAGRCALLVEAMTRRPHLLYPATRDWLHQEQRRIAYPVTMRVVDTMRSQGHAAVVSGAGPTVLVLTTTERAGEVALAAGRATQEDGHAWRIFTPGVPERGVSAQSLQAPSL